MKAELTLKIAQVGGRKWQDGCDTKATLIHRMTCLDRDSGQGCIRLQAFLNDLSFEWFGGKGFMDT